MHGTAGTPRAHDGYSAARWIVTALYLLCVGFSLLLAINAHGTPVQTASLLLTASYALLVLLLWLHERFPPPR